MKLNYLESFRGYMAIWVFIYHGLGFINAIHSKNAFFSILKDGSLPVIAFILLSGFVTHILLSKEEPFPLYIKRRALRLFPIYLIAFLISLLMLDFAMETMRNIPTDNPKLGFRMGLIDAYYSSHRFFNILSHIFLLHGIFPDRWYNFTYTIMGQSWSLTLEWQFYLFIPFVYNYLKTKNIFYLFVLILFSIITILSYRYMRQNSFLPIMIQYFLIGYFSYSLYKKWANENKFYLFYFLGAIFLYYCFKQWHIAFIIALWMIILYLQVKKNKISEFLLGHSISQYLGKISYSVYALHMIAFYVCIYILEQAGVKDSFYFSVLLMVTSFIFTIFISHLGYKYIESYFISIGKNLQRKTQNI